MSEHSPAPVPSRGVYGFALYLACITAFILYLIWALTPDDLLYRVGITYYPQKYWAIALPVYLLMGLSLFAFFFYPALNQRLAPSLESNDTLADKYALSRAIHVDWTEDSDRVPPAYDLDISHVCTVLYMSDLEKPSFD